MSRVFISLLILFQLCHSEVTYNNSGSLDYSLANMNGKNVNTLDLVFNNDFYIGDDHKVVFSPSVFSNDSDTYNSVIKGNVDDIREVYINELYYSYKMTERLSVAIGIFPFRKGTFYEYGFNGNRAGNGIYSITDTVLQGVVVSYNVDDTIFQVGKVEYNLFFKSYYDFRQKPMPITYDSYKNSGMIYGAVKQKWNEWYADVEISRSNQVMNGVNVINSDALSIALSYDDSVDTGRTYYTIVSGSKSKGDTSSLAYTYDYMYGGGPGDPNAPPPPPNGDRPPFTTNTSQYGPFESHGYFALVGVKQELDNVMFDKDMVLSAEYAYRSPGYHSLLAGRPLSPHAYADIGHFYNVSIGLRITRNNVIKLRYYMYDTNNESTKYGFTPVTTNSKNVAGAISKYDAVLLQWYYDF